MLAAASFCHEGVEMWARMGADVSEVDAYGHSATALAVCSSEWLIEGSEEAGRATLEALKRAGASMSAGGRVGATMLIAAARYGHAQAVRWLLEEGSQREAVETLGADGQSALDHAIASGNAEAVELLFEAGASMRGYSLADLSGVEPDVAKVLLRRAALEESRELLDQTPVAESGRKTPSL